MRSLVLLLATVVAVVVFAAVSSGVSGDRGDNDGDNDDGVDGGVGGDDDRPTAASLWWPGAVTQHINGIDFVEAVAFTYKSKSS